MIEIRSKILFLFLLLISCTSIASDKLVISSVYIGARGNNQYEAKLISVDEGAKRAFILASDKLLVRDDMLLSVPLEEINDAISDMRIRSEKLQIFPIGAFYSSIIDYEFDQIKLNDIFLKFGSPYTREVFFETLVIPVFKLNNKIYLTPKHTKFWLPEWFKFNIFLSHNKIILPEYNSIKDVINFKNYKNIEFREIMSAMPYRLFKRIVLTVCEFFTSEDGKSYFQVSNIIIRPDMPNLEEVKRYSLEAEDVNTSEMFEQIIKNFSKEFGRKENLNYVRGVSRDLKNEIAAVLDSENKPAEEDKFFEFRVEIFTPSEIDNILSKLDNIPEITRYQFRNIDSLNYQVSLYTNVSLKELAELFYNNGLSYYVMNKELVLLEAR